MNTRHAAAFYLAERAIGVASAFAVATIVARQYGAELFGAFSLAQSIAQFIVLVLLSGGEAVVVRELVRNAQRSEPVLRAGIGVLWRWSWAAAALFAAGYLLLAPAPLLPLGLILLLAVLPTPLLAFEFHYKARRAAGHILAIRGGTVLAMALVKVSLALAGQPMAWIAAAFAAEAAVMGGLYVLHRRRAGWTGVPADRAEQARHAVLIRRELLPAAIAAGLVMLFFRLNHLLLAALSDFAAVGHYAVAGSFVQLFDTLLAVVIAAVYPRLVEIKGRGDAAFLEELARLARRFALASIAFVACALALGPAMIEAAFGPAYAPAGPVFQIMALASLFTSSALVRAQFINASAIPRVHVANALAGIVALALFSVPAVEVLGAAGAALGLLLACVVSGLGMSFVMPSTRSVGKMQLRAFVLWRHATQS